uniref:Uncharacterized protein n=3 Tax=Magallana gigas TaxID=29159 RepID=A0A8W8NR14_MAGGI|nr:uncharacterized protein LOC105343170 [Crassostrea gigas]
MTFVKMQTRTLSEFLKLSQTFCRRNLSTIHFHKHRYLPEKSLTSVFNTHGGTRLPWLCGASQPFSTSFHSFHSSHKDKNILELLENGEEILPSDLELCTFTPKGAYIYLLETLHESLDINWQISIFLSSVLLRLAIIPATLALSKLQKRKFFVLSTMKRSVNLTAIKKKKGGVTTDLVKLNNSIFNHGPKDAIRFTLGQNLVEIAALLVFCESYQSIISLLGLDYFSTVSWEWSGFLLIMMWTSMLLSPRIAATGNVYWWAPLFFSLYPALFVALLPISLQSYMVPMFFARSVVQRLRMK